MRIASKHVLLAGTASIFLSSCTVTPEALTSVEASGFARDRLSRVTARQEPVTGPVDLYEAMARAIKYNLDSRVAVMEAALSTRDLDLAHYQLLPTMVAESGYAGRSAADRGAVSTSDPGVASADLSLSWNVLDFGLSYVRARQQADKVLIQNELRRKIVNSTIGDVRTAYWRAVSYERLVKKMRALQGRVEGALADTRALAASGTSSPLAALTYERELIQVERELQALEGQMKTAKIQLAALMNLPPDADFSLVIPERHADRLDVASDYHALYRTALANRPEMREIAYQLRVNDRELDAALLNLLPGLKPYLGLNYDGNAYLASATWVDYGAKASWNLINVFSLPATKAKIEAEGTLLDTRSLSVAMAVMTQVHVSRTQYLQAEKEYATASELAAVQSKLLKQVRAESNAESASQQVLIREEMNTLATEAKLDMAYAELQNAYANVYTSLGLDPVPRALDGSGNVGSLAAALRGMWIERGQNPQSVLASK